jgi:hypothetical protein
MPSARSYGRTEVFIDEFPDASICKMMRVQIVPTQSPYQRGRASGPALRSKAVSDLH